MPVPKTHSETLEKTTLEKENLFPAAKFSPTQAAPGGQA